MDGPGLWSVPAMKGTDQVHPAGAVAPAQTLWTVQAMRGIAALMVVIGHSQSAVGGVVTSQ